MFAPTVFHGLLGMSFDTYLVSVVLPEIQDMSSILTRIFNIIVFVDLVYRFCASNLVSSVPMRLMCGCLRDNCCKEADAMFLLPLSATQSIVAMLS